MIQVLQSRQEVEKATQALQQSSLPSHFTIEKNWDQWLLSQLLQGSNVDRQSKIIDLGCGDCCTLEFLAALSYRDLHGIDLTVKDPDKFSAYQLYQGDMTATPFPDRSFDVAVSISVIEHGVDLDAFFREAYRLLKPNGLLFATTDYWQNKISVDSSIKPFGLTWTIFSQSEIEQAIELARTHGFLVDYNREIPACTETTVSWYQKDYTFIALTFRKPAQS